LNYTSNRNIHPQCNRLCLQRAYRYKTVSYLLCVSFLKNNGAKRDSHHIGIRRTVAEVPIRTEDVIRTSDAEGWRCTEQILPHVYFLLRIHGGRTTYNNFHPKVRLGVISFLLPITTTSFPFIPTILIIVRLDFGLFFLITYHYSFFSIHFYNTHHR